MTTLADVRRPALAQIDVAALRATRYGYDAALVLAGSAVIALSAQVAIPLPFSPVPVTGQTFGVLVVGAALGRWRGAASILAYLAEGAAGIPVFAGAHAGLAAFVGPTGGYLLGFLPGAWLCGALAERGWDRRVGSTIFAMILGNVAIFTVGLPWLARYVGASNVWMLGFWPFLPGDVLKIALAAAALPFAWRRLGSGSGT